MSVGIFLGTRKDVRLKTFIQACKTVFRIRLKKYSNQALEKKNILEIEKRKNFRLACQFTDPLLLHYISFRDNRHDCFVLQQPVRNVEIIKNVLKKSFTNEIT